MTAKSETKPVAPAPNATATPPKTDAKAPHIEAKQPNSDEKTPETDAKTPDVTEKAFELAKEVVKTAEGAEKAPTGETTTIKVLRSRPKLGAWPGAVTTIPATLAAELITGEFAREASAEELAQVETSGYTETI